jgi:hypothetical protein
MATAGGVLGVLVVIAVVSGIATMGARFRQDPRREQLHRHWGSGPHCRSRPRGTWEILDVDGTQAAPLECVDLGAGEQPRRQFAVGVTVAAAACDGWLERSPSRRHARARTSCAAWARQDSNLDLTDYERAKSRKLWLTRAKYGASSSR